MKYLLIILTITCFSCQRKPYAFVQRSTQEQFVYKKNIVEQEILTSKIEAPMNIEAAASIAEPINNFKKNEVFESVQPFSQEKTSKPIIRKSKKVLLEKFLQKLEKNTFLNKKTKAFSTEKNYEKDAKVAGTLILGSLLLLLIAYLIAGSVYLQLLAGILALIALIAGISAFFIGNKAYNHLEKGNKNRPMAGISAAIGLVYIIGVIVGIIAIIIGFQNFGD